MRSARLFLRGRFDRLGVALSGLCVVHCLMGLLLVGALGLGGELLLAPIWHRAGLALAVVVGAVAIGVGVLRHGQIKLLLLAAAGLGLMGAALLVEHGVREAVLTVLGVSLVGFAHILNLRHAR